MKRFAVRVFNLIDCIPDTPRAELFSTSSLLLLSPLPRITGRLNDLDLAQNSFRS
jgi:hypothetical protein